MGDFNPAPLTDEELQYFREFFEAASREPRVLIPLPRRELARLWLAGRVDDAGYWLVCHHHFTAARRLWKIFGMWR